MSPSYFSYDRHPAAELFPMMNDDELDKLAADIRANGLREPIVMYEGQILDGRNRLRACELAEVDPRFEQWIPDGSPVDFVLSRNLHRRHLDESQRAVVAAKAKEMLKEEAAQREREQQFGRRKKTPPGEVGDTQKSHISTASANLPTPRGRDARVAKMFNVSERSVRSANRVLVDGDEQLIAAVTEGVVSVSDAAAIVKLPKPKQRELLELVRSGKSRTLRAAAKVKKPKTLPPAVLRSDSSEPQVLRGKVRRAYKFFRDEYETICRYVDMAAEGCGYNNPLIQRAREGLAAAQAAMYECDLRYGHAKTEKTPTDP